MIHLQRPTFSHDNESFRATVRWEGRHNSEQIVVQCGTPQARDSAIRVVSRAQNRWQGAVGTGQADKVSESGPRLPYPVTIIRARYGGVYEPGEWIAFPLLPENLPIGYHADDVTCMTFWDDYRRNRQPVGGGETPDAALEDLRRRIEGE